MHQSLCRFALLVALLVTACAPLPSADVSREDLERMKAASRAYMQTWLSNDADAVMATFVPEPVLSPFRQPFLEEQQAARDFWWPDGAPPTRVKTFDDDELEARGSGDLGFVRGNFTLVFDYDGTIYTSRGTYLHLLTRTADGWRISHRLWNDLARDP